MLSVLSLGAVSLEQVSRLSGGTRRCVCVALAFVAKPALVALDEPTAGSTRRRGGEDAIRTVSGRGVLGAGVAPVGRHAAVRVRGAGVRRQAGARGAGRAHGKVDPAARR
ncbi:putative ATP-binding cassette [Operophtera brumata]|uniref:Putative ATP-binding cassette n=1 Tax=Operophtera brumata TaxID=104452 RepID=A0A0L7LSF0_OPEBR|nr:putative ATP-binding cassette [Operophtera brumata]